MKINMPLNEALALAETVKAALLPGCERIEIAGSLRRRKPEIGDIELVAVPKQETVADLFGKPVAVRSLLDDVIAAAGYPVIKGDRKYKQLDLGNITCDLFLQPDPATWGVNMLLRTGCADFSHWLVTPRQKGGAMPGWMQSKDARLWAKGSPLDTPEEADVFRLMGLRWIEPEERTQAFWGQVSKFLCAEK